MGGDGMPTPILPPGEWDYAPDNAELANWRNYKGNIGDLTPLKDADTHHYGWRLVPAHPGEVDYEGPGDYFEGSSGADELFLGKNGKIHGFGKGNLAGGPDILVFDQSATLDFRTGTDLGPAGADNDLVIAGCKDRPDGSFGVDLTTIHTGPGHDWVFVRNLDRAAVDLGNGAAGRTDTVDNNDGDDLVVLRGNTHDFRVFGGGGNDTAVWYIDDNVQTSMWLGPNFFGAGGHESALWNDSGTDRLVLAVPASTPIVTTTPTPNGSLLVKATDGHFEIDEPTAADPFAVYCIECGESDAGRRTVIFEYNSANGKVKTGYFFVTAFEELQVGVGNGATVYRIDDRTGTVSAAPDLEATDVPAPPASYCEK